MKNFLIALQFLTILPVRIKKDILEADYGKSLLYFPLVGVIIGGILAFLSYVFSFLPPMAAASLLLAASALITGGMHLDGLADTCDGFYAGKTKEKTLEVMRDSRAGVMGVIGVTSLLICKFALFYSIAFNSLWKALFLMAVWGRVAQVLSCALSEYARENGKAKFFIGHATKKTALISVLFAAILSFMFMQFMGILASVTIIALVLFFVNYVKKRIGGMTGDTIGAISEVIEVITLFLALFLMGIQ